jgi:Na+/proline symporter
VHLYGSTPLSGGEIWDFLAAHEKLRVFDLDWRTADGALAFLYNPYHILPAVVGGFFLTMATHGTDHDMVQRLLTCNESAEGQRSLWVSGFVSVGVTCLFLGVGLLLFVYIQHLAPSHHMAQRATELAAQGRNGHVFLYYIVDVLPVGVGGLVLAAVFAAAMSSLDSALSAMSATFVSDFYQPFFRPGAGQRHYLRVGRWATAVAGVLLIGVALLVVHYYDANPETDLLSIALGIMTFFYGALLGIFLLGFMTTGRGNTLSNALGAVASVVVVLLIKNSTAVGWPWFIVIGTLVAFGIAFVGRTAASFVSQTKPEAG